MLLVLSVALYIWALIAVGFLIGWRGDGPFNWRIFFGPVVYYRWRDRTHNRRTHGTES